MILYQEIVPNSNLIQKNIYIVFNNGYMGAIKFCQSPKKLSPLYFRKFFLKNQCPLQQSLNQAFKNKHFELNIAPVSPQVIKKAFYF